MACLIFPFPQSPPLIGGAGIAGKSAAPETGQNGNRGKGESRPSLVRKELDRDPRRDPP